MFALDSYSGRKKIVNKDFSHEITHENKLLGSLPAEAYERIRPHLEDIHLPIGENIYECGDTVNYVYFPLDAVIHLFVTMCNGSTLEAGIIGAEGVLGVPVFMGAETIASQAVVFHAHRALRIRAEVIKQEFSQGGHFQQLILRYINASGIHLAQTAACNRIHYLDGRLCRWLLLMHDRLKTDCLKVTQDFIGQMLSTRRPYITKALGELQKQGIVSCGRGSIEILDRPRLEAGSCECYAIIRREFNFYKAPKSHSADNYI